ncbi:MAG: glycoside hydrolase family 88 protein [Prevotella sp.]|nr:glycoside hydrolase family 88 protein [Candidatus Prevotella equi]
MRILTTLIACILSLAMAQGQTKEEILTVAKRANDYFMAKWNDPTEPTKAKKIRPNNLWTRAVYFEGLMALNEVEPQQRYIDYTKAWGEFHKWGPYSQNINTIDADHQCCAQTYIMYYRMVGGDEKIATMRKNFDNQIATGNNQRWTWIDAIQMAMPAFAMMAKTTGDRKYMDYAMQSYTWSRDTCGGKLFNTAEGLWWRDANFVAPYKEKDGKNCYWSRGNGWVYAALCRVMNELSPKDPYYKLLKNDFLMMSKALLACQREDGFWNASLVSQDFAGKELTGTSLFLYGMSWGLRNGILKKKDYMPAMQKAWAALATCVHNDGFLGYVQGSGDRPASNQPVTYVKEPDFDDYGLGCFLLGATEYAKVTSGK